MLTRDRMRRAAATATPSAADAIVIFGAVLRPSRPSGEMVLRLDLGARLYRDGYAKHVVCSAGASQNDWMAHMIRDELLTRGVPATALVIDNEGDDTRQAVRSALRHSYGRWRRLVVVTSRYHVLRVVRECHRQGLDVTAAGVELPAIGWDKHSRWLRRRRAVQQLREIAAIWWYEVSWIPHPSQAR
jgi:uncharacterized SAM-binding protein YcdF (DUF218 family)